MDSGMTPIRRFLSGDPVEKKLSLVPDVSGLGLTSLDHYLDGRPYHHKKDLCRSAMAYVASNFELKLFPNNA
jgi:hypothetical protein